MSCCTVIALELNHQTSNLGDKQEREFSLQELEPHMLETLYTLAILVSFVNLIGICLDP